MKKKILLLVAITLVSLFSLEVAARMYLPDTPYHPERKLKLSGFPDDEIQGSMATTAGSESHNHSVEYQRGKFRKVTNTYYRYGFKRWGDTETNQTKVLILGDSHTWMRKVSNGNEWYAYLEEEFPKKEFFVMGQGGFGTTQELLIMEHMMDRIDPDVVLVQFCGNDFMDNSYRWRKAKFPYGGTYLAPYLIDNEIKLWTPYKKYRESSKVIDFLSSKLQYIVNTGDLLPFLSEWGAINYRRTMETNPEIPDIAFNKTIDIIRRMEKSSGNATLNLLLISGQKDDKGPYNPEQDRLCQEINVSCVTGIDEHVEEMAEKKNRSMHVVNGKYNLEGNRLAGKYIAEYLKKHNLLTEKSIPHNSTERFQ